MTFDRTLAPYVRPGENVRFAATKIGFNAIGLASPACNLHAGIDNRTPCAEAEDAEAEEEAEEEAEDVTTRPIPPIVVRTKREAPP
jgi:hypothetical protein